MRYMTVASHAILLAIFTLGTVACGNQENPPSEKKLDLPVVKLIADVPPFERQSLRLVNIPTATGDKISLFNGVDLNAFDPWLGYENPDLTFTFSSEKPLGKTGIGEVFKVVEVEGRPAIFVSGKIWGALVTKREYADYHLSLSYQWGEKVKPENPLNTGILYHSHGPMGGFMKTWMKSIEFDIMAGITGLMAEVGDGISMRSEIGKDGEKEKNLYRYMPGGKSAEVSFPTWVYPAVDAENPVGEWNKLDLYVYGDKAIHVVNGVPAVSLTDLTYVDNQGNKNPLSKGRIQLQSEGVEVYFRDISIQPIEKLPEVVVAKTFVHIFSFKWIDKAQPADKALAAEQILAFKGQVPGLLHLWLGDNVSENSTEFSTTGVMIFDDKASFDAYTSHPAHLELLSWLVPLIEALEIDYEPM